MQCKKLKTNMETGRVVFLPIRVIRPNPAQPRRVFDDDSLTELSQSIGNYGILQPLTVRRTVSGYELVAGERRLRAAGMAGISEVPCLVMQMDDRESEMAAMVENLQRQDLNFVEEALGLRRMMQGWNLSQEQVAKAVGKSQSAVANKLRILQHSDMVLRSLQEHKLTERHARALLKLSDDAQKLQMIERIFQQDLSVARTESLIKSEMQKSEKAAPKTNVASILNGLTGTLEKMQSLGIGAVSERRETESQIVLTITIPKSPQLLSASGKRK